MEPSSLLLAQIEERWREMFVDLAAGYDVAPTRRLRTEGLMEAAALLGLSTAAQLLARMDAVYTEVNGESLADALDANWQQFHPFPEIPAMQRRAPVIPSTKD